MNTLEIKVLKLLEPDPERWDYWTSFQSLSPISNSQSVKTFCERLEKAKIEHEKVMVAGDYDCDGIMATSIMVRGLKKYGLTCGFYIPDRIREGYGLNCDTVKLACEKGYKLLITVDNGVKAFEAIKTAKELGMDVIVTDHHHIEASVDCDCLVHPDTMEIQFSTLCGAGVAYELMRAMKLDDDYMLEMAGVASIGDVMDVTYETRAIIQNAIDRLNIDHEPHFCLLANDRKLNETSIAFQIVPKLNAIGRLSNVANVNNVVRYFLSDDIKYIQILRQQIIDINTMRKSLSDQMVKSAMASVHASDQMIINGSASYHEGIIGSVAGSLCSKFNKPCIIFAKNEQGYKGSMRSPAGFDCIDFLSEFDQFNEFGGHTNAAGFSLNLNSYKNFINYAKDKISYYEWEPEDKQTVLLGPDEFTIEQISSLDELRPFGNGFKLPKFKLDAPKIKHLYDIQGGKHRKYTLESGQICMRFNQPEKEKIKSTTAIDAFIGDISINQYQSNKQPQFIIEEIQYKG